MFQRNFVDVFPELKITFIIKFSVSFNASVTPELIFDLWHNKSSKVTGVEKKTTKNKSIKFAEKK
jgi:hypothetical protein